MQYNAYIKLFRCGLTKSDRVNVLHCDSSNRIATKSYQKIIPRLEMATDPVSVQIHLIFHEKSAQPMPQYLETRKRLVMLHSNVCMKGAFICDPASLVS